ncbi:hypothetical protein ABKN59_009591 [Abortiporus biennis]
MKKVRHGGLWYRDGMYNCRLPIEICERIIDLIAIHYYSNFTIAKLALVCKAWIPRSRWHLARRFTVKNSTQLSRGLPIFRKWIAAGLKPESILVDASDKSPHPTPSLQSHKSHNDSRHIRKDNKLTSDIVPTIRGHDYWFYSLPTSLPGVWRNVSIITLKHVDFTRAHPTFISGFALARVLYGLPQIQTLHLEGITMERHYPFSNDDHSSCPLQSLLEPVNRTSAFDSLRFLGVEVQSSKQASVVELFLPHVPNLSTLRLALTPENDSDIAEPISLTSNTSLESLEISIIHVLFKAKRQNLRKTVHIALAGIIPSLASSKLRRVRITLGTTIALNMKDFVNPIATWNSLDLFFSRKDVFPHLERVTFVGWVLHKEDAVDFRPFLVCTRARRRKLRPVPLQIVIYTGFMRTKQRQDSPKTDLRPLKRSFSVSFITSVCYLLHRLHVQGPDRPSKNDQSEMHMCKCEPCTSVAFGNVLKTVALGFGAVHSTGSDFLLKHVPVSGNNVKLYRRDELQGFIVAMKHAQPYLQLDNELLGDDTLTRFYGQYGLTPMDSTNGDPVLSLSPKTIATIIHRLTSPAPPRTDAEIHKKLEIFAGNNPQYVTSLAAALAKAKSGKTWNALFNELWGSQIRRGLRSCAPRKPAQVSLPSFQQRFGRVPPPPPAPPSNRQGVPPLYVPGQAAPRRPTAYGQSTTGSSQQHSSSSSRYSQQQGGSRSQRGTGGSHS